MSEPLIAVKKADGTTVRLPLSEVKKMSAAHQTAAQTEKPMQVVEAAEKPLVPISKPAFKIPVPEDAGVFSASPMDEVKKLLSTAELVAAPVEPLIPANFTDVQPGNSQAEPHLLHEELEPHEIKHPDLVAHVSYEDSALLAVKNAQINLDPNLLERFHSLTASLYKGVRTIDQVLAYATLAGNQGGLGLNQTEASRLRAALESLPGTPKMVAKPKTSILPNNTPGLAPATPRPRAVVSERTPTFGNRLPMRDVEAPAPAHQALEVMGPVEEMKKFNLTDWRRLAATPEKAKDMIINKFSSLKNESYFLYQDARAAWYASPLLGMYQKAVVDALNAGERLSERAINQAHNSQTELSAADISAIVEINQSLTV